MALLLVAGCLLSGRAEAAEGRVAAGVGVAVVRPATELSQLGPVSQLVLGLTLGDFFTLYGGLEGGYMFGGEGPAAAEDGAPMPLEPYLLHDLFLGLRYNLDVFTYIPFVGLALVAYGRGPTAPDGQPAPALGAKLSVGMQYRAWRDWSVGGALELHGALPQLAELSFLGSLTLNLGYHFRL